MLNCIEMLMICGIFTVQTVPIEAVTVTHETTFVVMQLRALHLWIIDVVGDSLVFLSAFSQHQMVTFINQSH